MDAKNEPDKVEGAAGADKASDPAGLPEIESPNLAPSQSARDNAAAAGITEHKVTTAVALFKGERIEEAPQAAAEDWWVRRLMTRTPPIAVALVLALAIGGITGLIGAFGGRDNSAQIAQANSLNETVARLSAEIATLKAAQENAGKSTSSQFARLSERVERAERAQVEPAKKISALSETVDRLERRTASSAAPATTAAAVAPSAAVTTAVSADVTGSAAAAPQSMAARDISRLPVIPGWRLQRVEGGVAYIYSREGMIEVGVGNGLPGGGRVEDIRRQDGRWIVVTSRGLVR